MSAQMISIPWHRRSDVNSVFAVIGLLVPPLLWFVCFNLITGDIYYPRPVGQGRIETWSRPNRILAYFLPVVQLPLILIAFSMVHIATHLSALPAAKQPEAEAVATRYFEAMKDPARVDPPKELYGSQFWKTVSQPQLERVNAFVHDHLGAVKGFELTGTTLMLSGKIRLEYDVRYERGRAKDSFLLGESAPGEGMRILGQHVEITK